MYCTYVVGLLIDFYCTSPTTKFPCSLHIRIKRSNYCFSSVVTSLISFITAVKYWYRSLVSFFIRLRYQRRWLSGLTTRGPRESREGSGFDSRVHRRWEVMCAVPDGLHRWPERDLCCQRLARRTRLAWDTLKSIAHLLIPSKYSLWTFYTGRRVMTKPFYHSRINYLQLAILFCEGIMCSPCTISISKQN